ncbi:MAG: hypothetical protein BZ138_06310, partial [Methanosphaera sp. rholeuAM270]
MMNKPGIENVPKTVSVSTRKLIDVVLSIVLMFTIGSFAFDAAFSFGSGGAAAAAGTAASVVSDNTGEHGADVSGQEAAIAGDEDESAAEMGASGVGTAYTWHEWNESAYPDYVRENGPASTSYEVPANGGIVYGGMDNLGRTTWAAGVITKEMRASAKASGRQSFDASCDAISGWGHNAETVIPSANGGKAYNGWFYNRSHLIADSLGGEASPENLVTGTRCQNVG